MTELASDAPLSILIYCSDPAERSKWTHALDGHDVREATDVRSHVSTTPNPAHLLIVVGPRPPEWLWRWSSRPPVVWVTLEPTEGLGDLQLPPSVSDEEFRAAVELLGAQSRLLEQWEHASGELSAAFARYGWRAGRPQRSPGELRQLAITDPLTGVYNRRHFAERQAIEFRWAQSPGTSLSLLLIDVDNFKSVNDVFGFPFGDQALAHVAARLQHSLRAGDVICRYGGDEFVVLAPGCNESSSLALAERLRAAVAASPIPNQAREIRLTCSLGIATATEHDPPNAAELLRRANAALDAAKRTGKNVSVLWSEATR